MAFSFSRTRYILLQNQPPEYIEG
jgi:hypothetical protein